MELIDRRHQAPEARDALVGQPVEVRSRFDDRWSAGWLVAEVVDGGFRVRRASDGAELPAIFSPADVRPAPSVGGWHAGSTSSPTRTGTESGTPRSRRSGSA